MNIETKINLVGESLFIRTLSFHYVGKCFADTEEYIALESSSWVADSGRFNNALTTGELSEVEPIPGKALIRKQNIVDILEWSHELPTEVT